MKTYNTQYRLMYALFEDLERDILSGKEIMQDEYSKKYGVPLSDIEVILDVAKGDMSSFHELVEYYENMIEDELEVGGDIDTLLEESSNYIIQLLEGGEPKEDAEQEDEIEIEEDPDVEEYEEQVTDTSTGVERKQEETDIVIEDNATQTDIQQKVREKIEREAGLIKSISYNTIEGLLKNYMEYTNATKEMVMTELGTIMVLMDFYHNAEIVKFMIEDSDFYDDYPLLHGTIQSIKSGYENNPVNYGDLKGVEKETVRKLTLYSLVQIFSLLTWRIAEKALTSKDLTQEEKEVGSSRLYLLYKPNEEVFLSDFAKNQQNETAPEIKSLLASCKTYLDNNTTIVVLRKKLKDKELEEERQRQLEAQREEKQEMKKQAKLAFENNEEYQDSAFLRALDKDITSILEKYRLILPSIFVKKIKGVLTPKGVLMIESDKNTGQAVLKTEYEYSKEAQQLFKLISETWEYRGKGSIDHIEENVYNFNTDPDVFDEDLNLTVTYLPSFFLKIANGIYMTEEGVLTKCVEYGRYEMLMKDMLRSYIIEIIHTLKKKINYTDNIYQLYFDIKDKITGLFLNFVYVNDFNMTTVIDLTFSVTYGLFTEDGRLAHIMKRIEDNLETDLKLVKNEGLYVTKSAEGGIGKLAFAINIANYTGETLFTYKAVESQEKAGYRPKLNKVLIGRKMDGSDATLDLTANTNIITTIMAGSRSGKGVQTLNILITAIGLGSGVAYADNKPDMAGIFWDLERELGVPILSIDAETSATSTGVREVRNIDYGRGIPYNIRGISTSTIKTIAYCKYIILMSALSTMLASGFREGESPILAKGDKNTKLKLFIMDEINQTADSFTRVLTKLEDIVESLPTKKERTDDDNLTEVYCIRVKRLIEKDAVDAIKSVQNAKGGISGVRNIFIGQNVAANKLFVGKNSTKSVFRFAIMSAATSILGVRHGSDKEYGLNGANSISNPNGIEFLGVRGKADSKADEYLEDPTVDATTGYFAMKPQGALSNTGYIYKSYLTLNENDLAKIYNNGSLTDYYDATLIDPQEDSFTYGLLGRVADPSKVYLEDLTRVVNGERVVNEYVGFKELMFKFIKETEGANYKEVLSNNLTSIYCMLFNLIRYAGFEHENLEEFLHDMSPEAMASGEELVNRMELERKLGKEGAKHHVYTPLTYKEVKEVVYSGTGYKHLTVQDDEELGEGEETFNFSTQETEDTPKEFEEVDEFSDATLPQRQEGYGVNLDEDEWTPTNNTGVEDKDEEDEVRQHEQAGFDFSDEEPIDYEKEPQGYEIENQHVQTEPERVQESTRSTFEQPPVNNQQPEYDTPNQQLEKEYTIYEGRQKEPPQQSQIEDTSVYGNNALSNVYSVELEDKDHHLLADNLSKGIVTRTTAILESSKVLLNQIKKVVGGLDGVHSFVFTPNGLIVNGVTVQINFSNEILMKYQRDIALKLQKGDYTPLFFYQHIYEMKNITELVLEVDHYLKMQVLQTMQIEDNPQKIRKKLKNLQVFNLNGEDMLEVPQQEYKEEMEKPSLLRSLASKTFNIPKGVTNNVLPSLPIQRVFNNKVVGSVAKGTLQMGAVWGLFNVAIPLFGFWGLVAGAFAVGNYMSSRKQ